MIFKSFYDKLKIMHTLNVKLKSTFTINLFEQLLKKHKLLLT